MRAPWFSASQQFYWSCDGTNLDMLIWIILQQLSDPALPIQIEASKYLHFLTYVEESQMTLQPVPPHKSHGYFYMITKNRNNEVVGLKILFRQPQRTWRGMSDTLTSSSTWWPVLLQRSALLSRSSIISCLYT